eukprot:m.67794 g.67794  ORF g.67794 m.67794 type:complete len:67 (-) comp12171_c1_seq4:78-278(-)
MCAESNNLHSTNVTEQNGTHRCLKVASLWFRSCESSSCSRQTGTGTLPCLGHELLSVLPCQLSFVI